MGQVLLPNAYARAHAGVADCCSLLHLWFGAGEDNLREAIAASRRAVEQDPESAEAHASCGLAESLGKNYEDAKQEFETSIRLNPHLFEAYYFYGRVWFVQGEFEKAADFFAGATHENSVVLKLFAERQYIWAVRGRSLRLVRNGMIRRIRRAFLVNSVRSVRRV